jgi:uncharacterized protein (TIGR03067 family)
MKLNLLTSVCDPQRLESFLNGELSDSQERDFTLHLGSCETCRRSLQQQAAEPEAWQEAEQFLRPCLFDSREADKTDSAAEQSTRQPLQIRSVLEAIGPTDDPAMLGRLGGYEVSGVVGAGGMGVVLKAIDKSLDRTVAIKVLAPHLATSGAARKRFAREAKAAAAVLHPNVIAIHSVSNDEALPYLVMPYVRGTSLQKRLDREGPLSLHEILRIGAQVAAGLAAAHAQGLVHRDIKPANILLEEGIERVTLTDFGLARAVDDATITHSGTIAGTPQFMSPEQARGEAVDPRSDLFSLGSVLYAVCTGRPPFRAETSYGVMRRITDDEPKAIRELNPDVPAWLCQIIAKLMSKQAADRYQSADEVAELLEACLAHVQQPTAAPLPASLATQAGEHRFGSIARRWLGVTAMTAAFALLGFFLWQSTAPPDISGRWTSEGGGEVVIEEKEPGKYEGAFTEQGLPPGRIQLKWSRAERRFNGSWQQGDDLNGKLSLRLMGDEIRGALISSKQSAKESGTPRLADFVWKRNYVKRLAENPLEQPEAKAKTDKELLQGTWLLVEAHKHGRKFEATDKELPVDLWPHLLVITGNKGIQAFTRGGRLSGGSLDVRFDLDPSKSPKQMNIVGFNTEWRAIYKLEGDTLTICSELLKNEADEDSIRPDEFSTSADSERVLRVYKRMKPSALADAARQQSKGAAAEQFNTETDPFGVPRPPTFDPFGVPRPTEPDPQPRDAKGFDPAAGIRVQVLLSAETHSREMLRRNIGFDRLTIMCNGLTGTVNGQEVDNFVGVIAHGCRLESFKEKEHRGKKYWEATLFVPQDKASDGSNHQLSQERLDELRGQGVQFWLDKLRGRGEEERGPNPVPLPTEAPAPPSSDPFGVPRPTVPDPLTPDTNANSDARGFSKTEEVVLSMGSSKFMLDLDTGKTMDPPATPGRPEEKLMDIHTDQMQPYHYPKELIGRGLQGIEVKASQWDASAAEVRRALTSDKVGPLKQMDLGPEEHPTYFFQTRDGAQGVLQLLEIVDEPKGVRLRYKTLLGIPRIRP